MSVAFQIKSSEAQEFKKVNSKPVRSAYGCISVGEGPKEAEAPPSELKNSAVFNPQCAPSGALLIPLYELERDQCKWPLYNDNQPMLFCGLEKKPDHQAYCEFHAKVAKRKLPGGGDK